jgi:hypothetical protein
MRHAATIPPRALKHQLHGEVAPPANRPQRFQRNSSLAGELSEIDTGTNTLVDDQPVSALKFTLPPARMCAWIQKKKVSWVLDADIRDFFTRLDQGWLKRFLEHRIADRRVLRLIQKWLSAGIIENGAWTACDEGVPQGASASV